ncbi:MAG: extensin family protein [Pseudomonadota bacterium]
MRNLPLRLIMIALFLASTPVAAQTVPVPQPNPKSQEAAQVKEETGEEERQPQQQPDTRIYQAACPAVLDGTVIARLLPPLVQDQCGERSPLEVREIAGIKLTAKAVLNCRMATETAHWIGDLNRAAEEVLATKVSSIATSTSFLCRRRNNAPDGKISEHGFANALDIIGFNFEDGSRVTLIDDWPQPAVPTEGEDIPATDRTPEYRFLRTVRDKACERFTTVLGPEANALHADHFHFDLGCHGKTCTYKICE